MTSSNATQHDIDKAVETHQKELIDSAATLFAVQQVYGDKVRDQTRKGYGRLVDAHLLTIGVLAAALLRINGKISTTTGTSEECDALYASFVIGLEPCESAIAEGRYLQAHALLRQEMEMVAQLKAVRSQTRKDSHAPSIGVLEESIARLYGDLSAAAHLSKHHIVRSVTEWDMSGDQYPEATSGTRYFPAYDELLARRSFGLHLMLILLVIEDLSIDLHERYNDDGFTKRETEALNCAVQLMIGEGVLCEGTKPSVAGL